MRVVIKTEGGGVVVGDDHKPFVFDSVSAAERHIDWCRSNLSGYRDFQMWVELQCMTCHRKLDDGTPESENCGGDCLSCMAEIGDPYAVEELARKRYGGV